MELFFDAIVEAGRLLVSGDAYVAQILVLSLRISDRKSVV